MDPVCAPLFVLNHVPHDVCWADVVAVSSANLSVQAAILCAKSCFCDNMFVCLVCCFVWPQQRPSLMESETSSGGAAIFSALGCLAARTPHPQPTRLLVNRPVMSTKNLILNLGVGGRAGTKQTTIGARTPPAACACCSWCGAAGAASQWQGKGEQHPRKLPEMKIAFFLQGLFALPFLSSAGDDVNGLPLS